MKGRLFNLISDVPNVSCWSFLKYSKILKINFISAIFTDLSKVRGISQSSTQLDVYQSGVPVKSPWTAGPADTLTNQSSNSFCTSGFSRTQESLRPGWMVDFQSLNLFTNIFVAGKIYCNFFSKSKPTSKSPKVFNLCRLLNIICVLFL